MSTWSTQKGLLYSPEGHEVLELFYRIRMIDPYPGTRLSSDHGFFASKKRFALLGSANDLVRPQSDTCDSPRERLLDGLTKTAVKEERLQINTKNTKIQDVHYAR